MVARRGFGPVIVVAAWFVAGALASCAPVVSRGGPGTLNPGLDEAPLSTKLDKKDLDYLVEQNLSALYSSAFWTGEVAGSGRPFVTIFPIRNDTSRHVDDEMATLLSSIETSLVNSGTVNVVSRAPKPDARRDRLPKWRRHGSRHGREDRPAAERQVLHHR